MGREIKRVPLDFNWPKDIVWGGYLNPFYKQATKCPHCGGSGSTAAYKALENRWYGYEPFKPEDRGSRPWAPNDAPIRRLAERNMGRNRNHCDAAIRHEMERLCEHFNSHWCHHLNADDVAALLKEGRLHDMTHEWTQEKGWQPKNPPVMPTPQQVNEWSLLGFGHDSCNCWIVCKAEAERLGIETACQHCDGDGTIWPTPEVKAQCEAWQRSEPPAGDGYQLWETVSEGSPISPVFSTPEELADWLVESPDYKWERNDSGTSREQWLRFITGPGWAPSMIACGGQVLTGVQAIT